MRIPKKIHFIFGMRKDMGGRPFSYFHYLNILSARKVNKDYEINFFYQYEPKSSYFDKLKEEDINFIKLDKVQEEVNGVKFANYAHKSDFLRLQILKEHGGIYLDSDVICLKPFTPLTKFDFVLGIECVNNLVWGTPNFTMMGSKNSKFLDLWIQSYYEDYRPDLWSYNSVKKPYLLLQDNLELATLVSPEFFSLYGWDDASLYHMFKKVGIINHAYSIHLWESKWWHEIIEVVNDRNKLEVDCTLTRLYKKYALGDMSIEFPMKWS